MLVRGGGEQANGKGKGKGKEKEKAAPPLVRRKVRVSTPRQSGDLTAVTQFHTTGNCHYYAVVW
jgi:hypothetical protein